MITATYAGLAACGCVSITQVRVTAVVQARMSSTRLPGKVLLPLAGRTVLEWVLRAAAQVDGIDDVALAISTNPADTPLAEVAHKHGIEVVRGSEDDVLSRFLTAARIQRSDAIIRMTSDCPFYDPELGSLLPDLWRRQTHLDHIGTLEPRSLPRGLDVELVSTRGLEWCDENLPADSVHRSHVTSAMYGEPLFHHFERMNLSFSHQELSEGLRATLDTENDYAALQLLAQLTGDRACGWREVVTHLASDTHIQTLTADIRQKRIDEG